jgi:hypothetical protein
MSEKDEFSKLSSIKKCPICRGKLVKGYFTIPRGIGGWRWDTYDNAPALKCERCGIAILDYGVVTRGHTPGSFLKKCVKCGKEIPLASEECSYCGAKQKEKEE